MKKMGFDYEMSPHAEPKCQGSSIMSDIRSIKTMDDLKKIGHIFNQAKKLDQRTAEDLLSDHFLKDKMLSQIIAICLIVPVPLSPEHLYQLILKICQDFTSIAPMYRSGLAHRLVESALMIGKGGDLYDAQVLQSFYKDIPKSFTSALLFLCASIKKPMYIDNVTLIGNHRSDTMLLYYYGANLLLLHKYDEAEQQLMRAYALSKYCKALRPAIVNKLSLACFLNQENFSVFIQTFSDKNRPSNLLLWDIDCDSNLAFKDSFYEVFSKEIREEHIRRVILDFARTTVQVELAKLAHICGEENLDEILAQMNSSGELKFRIRNGIIRFYKVSRQNKVDAEQKTINELLGMIKT